jgi:hypothetical protein
MIRTVILLAVLFCAQMTAAPVGRIVEVTGPTQIARGESNLEGTVDSSLEMGDSIETLKARVNVTFVDDTKMSVTEFSKLKIDEFVYDPSTSKGAMSVKAAFGTVRYASGKIAKNSRENIRVATPTAKVSVRGTDFTMTVDEAGKSMIILLPSLLDKSIVGQIEVGTLAGTVLLTQAFQATFVSSAAMPPSAPITLDFQDESRINNMILVETPKPVAAAAKEQKKETAKVDANDDVKPTNNRSNDSNRNSQQSAPQEVKLSLESLDVELIEEVFQTLEKEAEKPPVAPAAPEAPAVPALTSGGSFTIDSSKAILYIVGNKVVVKYTTKSNSNTTVTHITQDGTTAYPLNYGNKNKVTIKQTP